MSEQKGIKLFNLPVPVFLFISAIVLIAAYIGVLPEGMGGCFVFMIVVGTVLDFIGNKTPIINSYFGGGAIVVIFGVALLHYFHLLPEIVTDANGNATAYMNLWKEFDLVGNIGKFFKPTGAFLDWYIAALITGSILGMNRNLLMKAAARYFPAIFGGLLVAFALCSGIAAIMGYGAVKALLLIALPIMGGGMGAGASPLSKIFDAAGTMSAAEALSIMTPAVAIGNAISIVLGGLMVKLLKGPFWNGEGQLMQSTTVDPKELEISPEMQKKRDHITLTNENYMDKMVVDGEELVIGNMKWKVLETPGHTRGSICLFLDPQYGSDPDGAPVLISGDTLFHGAHGRTDFEGGNPADMIAVQMERGHTVKYRANKSVAVGGILYVDPNWRSEQGAIPYSMKANVFH